MAIRQCLMGVMGLMGILFVCGGTANADVPHVKVGRFPQEVASVFTVADGLPSDDATAVHLDAQGRVYAETAAGWAALRWVRAGIACARSVERPCRTSRAPPARR